MFGLAIIVIGVLANNYVYFHDVVTNGHGGAIHLGSKALVAIIVTLVVIAIGLAIAWRARAEAG
jgi:hypothetical protein